MIEENNCGLIMAGGIGTRFWPKSTEKKPKQFLNLIGNKTMIQLTYERLKTIMPIEKIFILTGEDYVKLLKEQIPEIPDRNIIIQPAIKNTAPCILLATLYINQIFKNTNITVLPSDHMIGNTQKFCEIIEKGNKYIKTKNNTGIVTIGITPNRPETGYGYIKCTNIKETFENTEVIKVEKFVEKPDLETAQKYLEEGSYLWNAGMFIFNTNYILAEFKEKFSGTYRLFENIPSIESPDYKKKCKEIYLQADEISFDYAIMEKSDSIYVIPGDFGWDDIGTWLSLQRYIDPDENNNYIKGDVRSFNSNNNVVYAGNKKVILLDVDNIFCIDSDDIIAIGRKEKLGQIHSLRTKIKGD